MIEAMVKGTEQPEKGFLPEAVMQLAMKKQAINVKDYGAKGDGIADDTASIRRVLDMAGQTGKPVYLPPGTYRYTQTLVLDKSNVTLYGAGEENTILRFDRGTGAAVSLQGGRDGIDGVGLTGLTVDCLPGKAGWREQLVGIQIGPQVGKFVLRNIHIRNGREGIQIDGGYSGLVDNVLIDESVAGGSVTGISITNGISNFFSRVTVACSGSGWNIGSGVDTMGMNQCRVTGTASGQPQYGVRLDNRGNSHDPRWIRMENCEMVMGSQGVAYDLNRGCGVAVTQCDSIGGREAFHISGAHDVQVVGGIISQCQNTGLDIQQGDNILFRNIRLSGASQATPGQYDGVKVGSDTSGVRVIGCQIGPDSNAGSGRVRYGVYVEAGARDYLLADNYIWQSVAKGVGQENGTVNGVVIGNREMRPALGTSFYTSPNEPEYKAFGEMEANHIVDVRAFGAVGDGMHDDTANIQAALKSMENTGGCLYFPAGTYRYSQTLKVERDNITVCGDGKGQTLLFFDQRDGAAVRLDGGGRLLENVGIRDLQVIAFDESTGARSGGYGVVCHNVQNYRLENVRVLNGYTGVYLDHAGKGCLTNVEVDEYSDTTIHEGGSQNGLVLEDSVGVWLKNVETNCRNTGWEVVGGTDDIHIVDSGVQKRSSLNPLYGLRVFGDEHGIPRNIHLANCFMEVGDQGVSYSLEQGGHMEFSQCYSAWGNEAFRLGDVTDVTIRGGEFFGCRESGVTIYGGKDIFLDGATISDCSLAGAGVYSGVKIGGRNTGVSVKNCRIGGNGMLEGDIWQKYGIEVDTNSGQYQFFYNDLRHNLLGGIQDNGLPGIQYYGNMLDGNSIMGVAGGCESICEAKGSSPFAAGLANGVWEGIFAPIMAWASGAV